MSPFVLSLIITAIGMGLVFVAILILWALMEIIVKTTADKEADEAQEEAPALQSVSAGSSEGSQGKKARAAAAAVAVALSLRKRVLKLEARDDSPAAQNIPSAWQTAGRLGRINQHARVFTRKG